MRKMNVIRSHLHEVYTETVHKVALSYEDDKRIIREDGIHTYAYDYFRKLSGGNYLSQLRKLKITITENQDFFNINSTTPEQT